MLKRALLWLPRAIYRVLRGLFLGIANWIAELPEWIASLFPDPSLERPEQLEPGKDLGKRIDRVQRAFDAELTRSSSLNMRGTALAVGSALAILLLAQFSSVWLDDNTWSFSDAADKAERILLYLSLAFLVICLVFAAVVITPRRRVGGDLKRLLRAMNEGRAQDEAATLLQATEVQRAWNEKRGRHLRVVTIPLAIAIAAGVGQAVIFAHWANPVDHSTCVNHDGNAETTTRDGLPPPNDQQTLAERYAPRVYFYPGEPWGPITPSRFIQGSKLVWNSPRTDEVVEPEHEIDENRLGADCEKASGGCYEHNGCDADQVTRPSEVDNRASGLIPTRGFAIDPNEMVKQAPVTVDNPDVPVYYEFRLGNQSRLRLTYWFFETNSQPHFQVGPARSRVAAHEGDWESIDVVLDKDSHDPQRVLFYAHGKDPMSREWPQVCVVDESAPPHDPQRRELQSRAGTRAPGRLQRVPRPRLLPRGSRRVVLRLRLQRPDRQRAGLGHLDDWCARRRRSPVVGVRRRLGRRGRDQGGDRTARSLAVEAVLRPRPRPERARGSGRVDPSAQCWLTSTPTTRCTSIRRHARG